MTRLGHVVGERRDRGPRCLEPARVHVRRDHRVRHVDHEHHRGAVGRRVDRDPRAGRRRRRAAPRRRAAGRRSRGGASSSGSRPRRARRGSGTRSRPAAAVARATGRRRARAPAARAPRAGTGRRRSSKPPHRTRAQTARTCTSAWVPAAAVAVTRATTARPAVLRRTCTAPRCSADGEAAWRNAIAELDPRSCADAGHDARTVFAAPRIGELTTTLNSACDGLIEALYAVRARPPPPEVGMQPRNGRKLDVAGLGRNAGGVEDHAAPRRHAGTDRAARLAAEPDVDVGRRHPRVGAGDDVPLDGAGELVVDPSGRDDDPRAGDGQAHAQPLALVGGPGAPGRERSEERGAEDDGERERAAADHNGLRVHASERPDATSRKTTPTPANAAVTSRFSRLEPIRLPRSL